MNDIKQEVFEIKQKNSWNKTDLTIMLAEEANIPKIRASEYINILTGTIAEALENGKKVTISDFGTFQVSERRSFKGRNPKTGAPIKVPVRRIPVFRAGKRLKTSLNTPQIKECKMHGKNKLLLRFTKLIDKDCKALLKKDSYEVLLDGKSLGKLKSVKIHEEETEVRNRDEQDVKVSGVRSVILECSKNLFGQSLEVLFKGDIVDVDGNSVLQDS